MGVQVSQAVYIHLASDARICTGTCLLIGAMQAHSAKSFASCDMMPDQLAVPAINPPATVLTIV